MHFSKIALLSLGALGLGVQATAPLEASSNNMPEARSESVEAKEAMEFAARDAEDTLSQRAVRDFPHIFFLNDQSTQSHMWKMERELTIHFWVLDSHAVVGAGAAVVTVKGKAASPAGVETQDSAPVINIQPGVLSIKQLPQKPSIGSGSTKRKKQ